MKRGMRKRISLLFVFILAMGLLSGCAQTPKKNFYETSYSTLFQEGFGLSENAFFKRFEAADKDNWEKETGEAFIPLLQTTEKFPYIQYTVSEPVEINGLPFMMVLNFYEGKGLTNIGYTATEDAVETADLYEHLLAIYGSFCDTLGEPGWNHEEEDSVYWERYGDSETFFADLEKRAAENPGLNFRQEYTVWKISENMSDGDLYDEYASLYARYPWPLEETVPVRWDFTITRTYHE